MRKIFDETHNDPRLGTVHRTINVSETETTIIQTEERSSGGATFHIVFSADEWNAIIYHEID